MGHNCFNLYSPTGVPSKIPFIPSPLRSGTSCVRKSQSLFCIRLFTMGQGAGSRVGTGRFQAMGQTGCSLYSPAPPLRSTRVCCKRTSISWIPRVGLPLHSRGVVRLVTWNILAVAVTLPGGCQIGHVEHTGCGCHHLVNVTVHPTRVVTLGL
jgi:hypothetical protein